MTIYLLIGPKGSGKSHIGELISKKHKFLFINVEPFFITAKNGRDDLDEKYFEDAWELVKNEIQEKSKENENIILESLGTFTPFKEFLADLKNTYDVKLINISASKELCKQRIKGRDAASHLHMSDELIDELYALSVKETYDYDFCIQNENLSDENILARFLDKV